MRLTVTSHLTLDGVVQSNGKPEPELHDGFEYGGWQVPYIDDEFVRLVSEWMASADAFLLGRRTYELFAEHWAKVTDSANFLATKLNTLPKYVVSKTLARAEWSHSRVLRGDVAAEVARLKRDPGRELQVHGSGTLVLTLLEQGLVDELRLFIHPVVLGAGKRLFGVGTAPTALRLVDTKSTGRGVVVHVYEPSGKPQFGSVALEHAGEVVREDRRPR
jgi:dihydrofolate reductase